MRYMLLICPDESRLGAMNEEQGASILAEYGAFREEMGRRGVLQDGARLRPSGEAATVRVNNGKTLVTDGPLAETKEQLGGFFMVDCRNRDEAVEIAAKIPGARLGAIEVRPVWEMD